MRSLALCALALVAGCIATPPPPRPGGPADPSSPEAPVASAPAALQLNDDAGQSAAIPSDAGSSDMSGLDHPDGGMPRKRRKKQGQGQGDTQADGETR